MKKRVLFCFALTASLGLSAQVIDFETTGGDGDPVGTIGNGDECDVTFSSGSPTPGSGNIYNILGPVHHVAKGGTQAFLNALFLTDQNCGVSTPTNLNMANPNQPTGVQLGCQLIAPIDDFDRSVIVDYAIPTRQASGFLLDVENRIGANPQWPETFDVIYFQDVGSGTFREITRDQITPNSVGGGDANAAPFNIRLNNAIIDRIVIDHVGNGTAGVAFDNFSACSVDPLLTLCCEEATEVDGQGFASEFPYSSNYTGPTTGVNPGEYGVMSSNDVSELCNSWDLQSPSCTNEEAVFVVNGRTGQAGSTVVLEYEVGIAPGEYNYCFDAQRLHNCCFDNFPPLVTVEVLNGGVVLNSATYEIATDEANPCDWITRSIDFTKTGTGSVTIRFSLDETREQDGNDFVLDNLSLKRKSQMPSDAAQWTITSQTPETFNGDAGVILTADWDQVIRLDEGCTYLWSIFRVDGQGQRILSSVEMGNASRNWPLNGNTFPGYNGRTPEGFFPNDVDHEIVLDITCPCSGGDEGSNDLHKNESIPSGGEKNNKVQSDVQDQGLSVYPNPTNRIITIVFEEKEAIQYRGVIKNLAGAEVLNIGPDVYSGMEISLEGLAKGAYLLEVSTDNEMYQQRIVRE